MTDGNDTSPTALACLPGAISADERVPHFALVTRLFTFCVRGTQDVEEGRAYRFDAGDLDAVIMFVSNERRCCPFLAFTIEAAASGGPVWLSMTGPAGTRDLLDAQFPVPANTAAQ